MKKVTVFHDGEVLQESDIWITTSTLPYNAYLRDARSKQVIWYLVCEVEKPFSPIRVIEYEDLPKWVKAWELIL